VGWEGVEGAVVEVALSFIIHLYKKNLKKFDSQGLGPDSYINSYTNSYYKQLEKPE